MAKRTIICDTCEFEGTLTYVEGMFGIADISFCPACGSDISEEYNLSDEDLENE